MYIFQWEINQFHCFHKLLAIKTDQRFEICHQFICPKTRHYEENQVKNERLVEIHLKIVDFHFNRFTSKMKDDNKLVRYV